jgi:hypothetical protein
MSYEHATDQLLGSVFSPAVPTSEFFSDTGAVLGDVRDAIRQRALTTGSGLEIRQVPGHGYPSKIH